MYDSAEQIIHLQKFSSSLRLKVISRTPEGGLCQRFFFLLLMSDKGVLLRLSLQRGDRALTRRKRVWQTPAAVSMFLKAPLYLRHCTLSPMRLAPTWQASWQYCGLL